MANKAIEIVNLSKKYNIADIQQKHETLAAAMLDNLKRPIRRVRNLLGGNQTGAAELNKVFWALQDISFDVEDGETIGIIGRNGAGKSTLLKILSRISDPSGGYARINGRVGSLLEVGTGFNLELTGRENVYLNGSILGMRIAEINQKFDEIVDFAGVQEFIDTPVKHYSSGMKVRLAFAVAAHLDPEILMIDEVLAVGDYAFQKKSLGKMKDVTKSGRTVLFVSHQLDMVREICDRVVLLNAGRIEMIGAADEVIDYYLESFSEEADGKTHFTCPIEAERPFQFLAGRVLNAAGEETAVFDIFEPITVEYDYEVRQAVQGVTCAGNVFRNGAPLFITWDSDTQQDLLENREKGVYRSRFTIPAALLKDGHYHIDVALNRMRTHGLDRHLVPAALDFEVLLTSKAGEYYSYSKARRGIIAQELAWEVEQLVPDGS